MLRVCPASPICPHVASGRQPFRRHALRPPTFSSLPASEPSQSTCIILFSGACPSGCTATRASLCIMARRMLPQPAHATATPSLSPNSSQHCNASWHGRWAQAVHGMGGQLTAIKLCTKSAAVRSGRSYVEIRILTQHSTVHGQSKFIRAGAERSGQVQGKTFIQAWQGGRAAAGWQGCGGEAGLLCAAMAAYALPAAR